MPLRLIVIGLVLINILLIGWVQSSARLIPPASTVSTPKTPESSPVPHLRLLDKDYELASATLPEARSCYTIGPLQSANESLHTQERLAAFAERIELRQTDAEVERGYWVYIDGQGSREQAVEYANQLGSMGVEDYFVVTGGELENTVSLGLFNGETNARKREAEIRALGFDVQVEPRREVVPQYWIDYELVGNPEMPSDYVIGDDSAARHLSTACPADTAAPESVVAETGTDDSETQPPADDISASN